MFFKASQGWSSSLSGCVIEVRCPIKIVDFALNICEATRIQGKKIVSEVAKERHWHQGCVLKDLILSCSDVSWRFSCASGWG